MASILQLAGMLPRDPQFREWAASHAEVEPLTVDEAAEFIRVVCQITSRRALATDKDAEARFHQFLRRPFVAWREQQQSHRRAA
jgi:hypothetical protein